MKYSKIKLYPLVTVLMLSAFLAGSARAQMQGPQPPAFLVTTASQYDFSDTVDLLKGAIEEQNLMVVHEIDAQRMLRMVDVQAGGMKQILFFHPRYMKRIMETNRNGGIAPPLKFIVMEMPNGRVMVRYERPTHLLEAYEGLEDLASELESVVEDLVAEIES